MPTPVRRSEIMLGPAERVEVVVDFAGAAGESGRAAQRPAPRRPQPARRAHLRRGADAVPGRLAAAARPHPRAAPAATAAGLDAKRVTRKPDRSWEISIGGLFKTTWLINGRTFNPARADAFPKLGTTETWEIVNRTNVAHVMHLHQTDWYLLSRNGKPPPPWEDCLKETFFVYPGERILLAGHFADHTGKFVDPLPHARPRGPRPDEPVPGC